jgi:hypothetical protein
MEATFARMTEGLEPIPDYMVPPEAAAQPDFVSDYATGRALQPGEEEDAAAGFPMTMNDLQNQSSPAGNFLFDTSSTCYSRISCISHS